MEKQGVEMIENKMLEETKNAKFKPNIVLQILIFFLAFGCSYLIQVFAIFAILLKLGLMYLQSDVLNNVMQGEEYLIFGLLLSVTYIAVAFVYCLCIEKRSLTSMGISKKRVISSYSIGIAIGDYDIGCYWNWVFIWSLSICRNRNNKYNNSSSICFCVYDSNNV